MSDQAMRSGCNACPVGVGILATGPFGDGSGERTASDPPTRSYPSPRAGMASISLFVAESGLAAILLFSATS